jgi:hypothetical protein
MTGIDLETVAYHVRRLDGDALAAFVADLWEARGYDVTRDGGTLVASDGTDRVRVRVGTAGAETDGSADVLVAPDGSGGASESRVVDAAALAEMLGYAVDRAVARELCIRHLGAPPESLPAPPTMRVRRRAGAVLARGPPVVGVLVVVVAAGLVAGAAIFPGPGGADGGVGPGTSAETTPYPNWFDDDHPEGRPATGDPLPPGVNESGIENVTALAVAHDRALGNRSHTIRVDWYRPRGLRPNGTRVQRDIDIAAAGDRYLIVTSEETGDQRRRLGAVYNDGFASYAAVPDDENETYSRVFRIDPRQNAGPTPESVRERIVTRYLSTPTTNVSRVQQGGEGRYRIVGSGPPETEASVALRNYSVEALVDSRGFVRDVIVEATVRRPEADSGDAFRIRREITYDRVGETTVAAPEWYERRDDREPDS